MRAFISGVALAALSIAGTARAQSSASCYVSVTSGSENFSKDVFIKQGFELAGYLCDEYHPASELAVYAENWVGDTAIAYARAFVHSIIDCSVTGQASADVDVSGYAETSAGASATAILEGYASVSTCNGCDVYMDLFIKSTKKVFVEAVAKHHDSVSLYADGGQDSVYRDTLIEDIKLEIIDVYVSYVIDLYASMTGGNGEDESQYCWINVDACASTGEANCCNWSGDAGLLTEVENAFEQAAISIPHDDINCKEVGDTTYHDFAKAIARAYAETYVSVYGSCYSDNPEGNACIWGTASADAYVSAAAEATATAWIAESYCGCNGGKDVMVSALETVYANAYSDISTEICVNGVGSADINVYLSAYEEKFGKATAEVFASVWQDKYNCELSLDLSACAGEANDNALCLAPFFDGVKHCKSDDHHCVQINKNRAVCKPVHWEWPKDWVGEILKCPKH